MTESDVDLTRPDARQAHLRLFAFGVLFGLLSSIRKERFLGSFVALEIADLPNGQQKKNKTNHERAIVSMCSY